MVGRSWTQSLKQIKKNNRPNDVSGTHGSIGLLAVLLPVQGSPRRRRRLRQQLSPNPVSLPHGFSPHRTVSPRRLPSPRLAPTPGDYNPSRARRLLAAATRLLPVHRPVYRPVFRPVYRLTWSLTPLRLLSGVCATPADFPPPTSDVAGETCLLPPTPQQTDGCFLFPSEPCNSSLLLPSFFLPQAKRFPPHIPTHGTPTMMPAEPCPSPFD